jgi:hypothetical protein
MAASNLPALSPSAEDVSRSTLWYFHPVDENELNSIDYIKT